ncbi:MAG: galactose ABC transporter substrate-binding protein [Clostridia bacterium]|nr:galactose ABC transporter substrate-binding protein [Clostridia bacterium]
MRRILLILLTACLLMALLPGCEEGKKTDGPIRIGVAVYQGEDTYISNMTAAMQEAVSGYTQKTGERVYLTIADAQDSQSTQNDQIDRFISLGYDVLCVNMVDRTDAARVIDKAQTANIPVIFFNREPVREDLMAWDKAFYVGSDARMSAVLQAGIILDLWDRDRAALDKNGDGVLQYVMLEGEIRHQDTIIRTEVPIQTMKAKGVSVERLDGGLANWDRDQASALTENLFETYGDSIEIIFCNNDDMALGAVDAVERMDLDFHNIVGIDGTPQGLEAVKDGKMLGTVVMDFPTHARTMFDMSLALAKGEDMSKAADVGDDHSVRIPMYTVTPETAKD